MAKARATSEPLPQSVEHERAAIGCMLDCAECERLLPEHFAHEGRRLFCMAVRAMRETGALFIPKQREDWRHAAQVNAYRVAVLVMQTGLWPMADPPEYELRECLEAYGNPGHLPYYADQLRALYLRRVAVDAGERLAKSARHSRRRLDSIVRELEHALTEARLCL